MWREEEELQLKLKKALSGRLLAGNGVRHDKLSWREHKALQVVSASHDMLIASCPVQCCQ